MVMAQKKHVNVLHAFQLWSYIRRAVGCALNVVVTNAMNSEVKYPKIARQDQDSGIAASGGGLLALDGR